MLQLIRSLSVSVITLLLKTGLSKLLNVADDVRKTRLYPVAGKGRGEVRP